MVEEYPEERPSDEEVVIEDADAPDDEVVAEDPKNDDVGD